ncbi:hypothetical protein KDA_54980 [Dictyobacter alpinus]|uniref:Uncharacterized protein n=1 Tax=Dictyobacter alpinus TaxID=2014873 RepID=A0A402BF46_9CHLR|nr:hypothetical protein KDA_54980 [Dictyobacter alpinus]
MTKHIFLIQSAGAGAYEMDKQLASSLSHSPGSQYEVHCPALPHEDDASYEEWKHLTTAHVIHGLSASKNSRTPGSPSVSNTVSNALPTMAISLLSTR